LIPEVKEKELIEKKSIGRMQDQSSVCVPSKGGDAMDTILAIISLIISMIQLYLAVRFKKKERK